MFQSLRPLPHHLLSLTLSPIHVLSPCKHAAMSKEAKLDHSSLSSSSTYLVETWQLPPSHDSFSTSYLPSLFVSICTMHCLPSTPWPWSLSTIIAKRPLSVDVANDNLATVNFFEKNLIVSRFGVTVAPRWHGWISWSRLCRQQGNRLPISDRIISEIRRTQQPPVVIIWFLACSRGKRQSGIGRNGKVKCNKALTNHIILTAIAVTACCLSPHGVEEGPTCLSRLISKTPKYGSDAWCLSQFDCRNQTKFIFAHLPNQLV